MLVFDQLATPLDRALSAQSQMSERISTPERKQLLAYLGLVSKWNKVFNLTAIRDSTEMLNLHLLDCLWATFAIERLTGIPRTVVDVGSGAGFPGVVMAIIWPQAQVHCVDTVSKKAAFINQVRAELALSNLHGHHTRIEDFSLSLESTEKPDLITCRAYATIAQLMHTSHHLTDQHTTIAAMKAKRDVIAQELLEANDALQNYGLVHQHIEALQVPNVEGERNLVLLRHQPLHPTA
jgi:16S rRNA (guanine527-N7)-methyltransferase